MDETVARLNIEHYRKLLAEEKDEVQASDPSQSAG